MVCLPFPVVVVILKYGFVQLESRIYVCTQQQQLLKTRNPHSYTKIENSIVQFNKFNFHYDANAIAKLPNFPTSTLTFIDFVFTYALLLTSTSTTRHWEWESRASGCCCKNAAWTTRGELRITIQNTFSTHPLSFSFSLDIDIACDKHLVSGQRWKSKEEVEIFM